MHDDVTLLRLFAREKSEEAFAEVVRRHLDLVYSAALRRTGGDAHGAKDVAQQVFIRLARKADSLSEHPVLAAWLYAATRNAAIDHLRTERRRRKHETEAWAMSEFSDKEKPGVEAADWERLRPLLDGAIDELGARDRDAVVLRFFARRSFREIGAALRVSEDGARMRVDRALEKLRTLLAGHGVTSTGAALGSLLANGGASAAPVGLGASVIGAAVTAATTGGGVGGANLLLWVKNSQLAAGLVGVLAVVLVGLVTRERLRLNSAESAVAAARTSYEATLAAARRVEVEVRTAGQEISRLQVDSARRAPTLAPIRTNDVATLAPPAAPEHVAAGKEYLARHPAVRPALIDWFTAKVNFLYGPLFQELGLSPSQIAAFQDLVRGIHFFGAWGPNQQFLEFDVSPDAPRDDGSRRLRELLGDAGYQRYVDFNRTTEARELTAQIGSRLFFSEAPLSPVQAKQLAQLMAETPRRRTASDERYWGPVLAKASGFLLPAQVQALAGIRTAQQLEESMLAAETAVESHAPSSAK